MLATDLISNIIIPLSPEQTGEDALNEMQRLKITHLPVVDEIIYKGLVAEQDILDVSDTKQAIKSYKKLPAPFVFEDQLLFEVMGILNKEKISTLPVLSKDKEYVGAITEQSLFPILSSLIGAHLPGSLLTLEVNPSNYHLSEIVQIVETNDARVLGLYVVPVDTDSLDVIVRIGQVDISNIIRAFERYNYNIKSYYMGDNKLDDLYIDRYNMLMRYMNT